jgi:hypothetical protein
MPIDFSKLLSPEIRARLAFQDKEIRRQYALPDRFLAEELLRLAREVRDAHPDLMPQSAEPASRYFWDVIPEIARRLGASKFRSNERCAQAVVQKTDEELRKYTGYMLKELPNHLRVHRFDSSLLHEPINGNPVCLALDRLAPPQSIDSDPIAKSTAGPALSRGVPFSGVWTPALLDYANKTAIRPRAEDIPMPAKPAAKVLSFHEALLGKNKQKGATPKP